MKKFLPVISSIYLGIAAMVMTWQTLHVFAPASVNSFLLLSFSGCSTFTAYIGYWHFMPSRIVMVQRVLLVLGLIVSAILSLFFYNQFVWIGISVGCTLLYTAPLFTQKLWVRKIHLGKSILLAVIWTYSTTLLPLQLSDATSPSMEWFILRRFTLLWILCILFDLRDLQKDKLMGSLNFLHYLKSIHQHILVYSILLVFFYGCWGLLQQVSNENCFNWIAPGFILGIIYPFVKKIKSVWFYYLFIDGLMMLTGLLMILERF